MAKDKSKKPVDDDEIIEIPDSDGEVTDTTEEADITNETEEKIEPNTPEVNIEKVVVDKSEHTHEKETKTIIDKRAETVIVAAEPEKSEETTEKPDKKTRKKLVVLIIAGAAVLIASASAYYVQTNNKMPVETSTTRPAQNKDETKDGALAAEIDGNTYLSAPKLITDVDFYKSYDDLAGQSCDNPDDKTSCKPNITKAQVKYYQIGATKNNQRIIVNYYVAPELNRSEIAIETAKGDYELLAKMDENRSDWFSGDNYAPYMDEYVDNLADGVNFNTKSVLKDLKFSKTPTVNGQKMATNSYDAFEYGRLLENGLSSLKISYSDPPKTYKTEKVGTDNGTDYYRLLEKEETNYNIVEMYGVKYGLYAKSYNLDTDISKGDKELDIAWTSGESNKSKYFSGGPGCGTFGFVAATNVSDVDLTQIGTSGGGQKVYQLSTTHPLTKELYEDDYVTGAGAQDDSLKNLTMQQFMDKHSYFIAKNDLGDYVVYQRGEMFMRGGCGKPVIYLYPETQTLVNVAVGADVVVSEPLYPTNGWKNVLASPDGTLNYQDNTYGSLFWEGYGYGPYPAVDSGTVVHVEEAVSTIRSQLHQQGLNTREIDDFVEYWAPKLPTNPYIRLTWFNTAQLDQLAPLRVTPAPQTMIRVFLDFEGLDQPIAMTPQHLTSRTRQGFTLVEWGGLLKEPFTIE